MPVYTCPACGLVVLDTKATIQLYDQGTSPFPGEPKIFCGRDGTVLLWGKGTILTRGTEVCVDGLLDPATKPPVAALATAATRRATTADVIRDVVRGGVSQDLPVGVARVTILPAPHPLKDKP